MHELMHVKEIVKICSLCNKTFFDVDEYGLHMEQHFERDEEKNYACGECGASFAFKHHLDRHSCSDDDDDDDDDAGGDGNDVKPAVDG